jgi:hypothetical protein
MKTVWWIVLAAGVIGVIAILWANLSPKVAPLNASGYTYPSSPGA